MPAFARATWGPLLATPGRFAGRSRFGTWGPSSLALCARLFGVVNATRPRSPRAMLGGDTSHSSAGHLLSGAIVYHFQAEPSHAGAWSLWRRERRPAFVLGWSVGRRGSQEGGGSTARHHGCHRPSPRCCQPPVIMARVEPKVLNPSDELCTPGSPRCG